MTAVKLQSCSDSSLQLHLMGNDTELETRQLIANLDDMIKWFSVSCWSASVSILAEIDCNSTTLITKLGHQTFVCRWSSPNLTSGVLKMLWPRPLALRSSVVPLISTLTLPFRFMWGLLTCFTQAAYRHLLPSMSLVVASTHSVFLVVVVVVLVCTWSTHLSTSFLFRFCSCLNWSSRVFDTKNQKPSNFLPSSTLKTLQLPQTATLASFLFYHSPIYLVVHQLF